MLNRDEAKHFYDRFGAKQDAQKFYEDKAIDDLLAHMDLSHACVLFEFGCGTGRFAERVLDGLLPDDSWYRGVDLSTTMVELSNNRLQRFGNRVEVTQSDGAPTIKFPDSSVDAVVSAYVLDILPAEDAQAFVNDAHRVLTSDGQLGLISLISGPTFVSHLVTALWKRLFRLRPSLLGGCRPIELRDYLPGDQWNITHRAVVIAFGIPSEVIVARPI